MKEQQIPQDNNSQNNSKNSTQTEPKKLQK